MRRTFANFIFLASLCWFGITLYAQSTSNACDELRRKINVPDLYTQAIDPTDPELIAQDP